MGALDETRRSRRPALVDVHEIQPTPDGKLQSIFDLAVPDGVWFQSLYDWSGRLTCVNVRTACRHVVQVCCEREGFPIDDNDGIVAKGIHFACSTCCKPIGALRLVGFRRSIAPAVLE
jgi:hypothetical protein